MNPRIPSPAMVLNVIIKYAKLLAQVVRNIPKEKKIPEATPIFRYPKVLISGPLMRPRDMANELNVFMISEASVAESPISGSLFL